MHDQQKLAWCMFFCAVQGWQYHPGTKGKLNTAECARIADEMLDQYLTREDVLWDGWQPQTSQDNSPTAGSAPAPHTRPTEQTSNCNESNRNGKKA